MTKKAQIRSGFTVVELIIVIAVIGILAGIVVVSYNGWRQSITVAGLKSDLSGVASAMENARNFGTGYPESVPSTFNPSSDITITGGSIDGAVYCIDAASASDTSISYYITGDTKNALEGDCDKAWKQIAVAHEHVCGLTYKNKAYCWGLNNGDGQLGIGNTDINKTIPTAVDTTGVLSGKLIKTISVGYWTSCAIANDDKAYCWGKNGDGQVGDGSTVSRYSPVAVSTAGALSGKTVKSVSVGYYHACALDSLGFAYCWGYGYDGQLGTNTSSDSYTPILVYKSGLLADKAVKQLGAGASRGCAVASDDKAYCWGLNGSGQLGDGSSTKRLAPVAVSTAVELSGKKIKSISPDGDTHTCAVDSNGKAYCWGDNFYGQLGNNSTTPSLVPVSVDTSGALSGKTIKSITTGLHHTCAIASDSKAYCWGSNTGDDAGYGQLGNNSTSNSLTPVPVDTSGVLSGKTIRQISAGWNNTCAITSDNKAYCWGSGDRGELGNNSVVQWSLVPVAVVDPL